MFPYLYLYIYLVLMLLTIIFDVIKVKSRTYERTFNLIYIFMAMLVAFRYYSGSDTGGYMLLYDNLPTIDKFSTEDLYVFRAQPLYILFNVICKSIWNNFVLVQIVQAFLFYHSFYYLLKKLQLNHFFILFIFFGYMYLAEMSAIRESMGLACCFYGMRFYLKNKWHYYYVLVFIGFMFHSGVIIFALFPFIKCIKRLNVCNVLIIMAISFLIPIVHTYLSYFDILLGDNSIYRYGNQDNNTNLRISTFLYDASLIIFLIYYIYREKGNNANKPRTDFLYLGGVIYVMISFIGSAYIPIMYRLTSHLSIFFYYTVCEILKNINKNHLSTIVFIFLVFYSPIARFFSNYTDDRELYRITYCSVFSSDDDKEKMRSIMRSRDYDIFKQ